MTLTYKVTLESYSVDLSIFEFHKQIHVHVSSKIISVAYLGLEIGTVM